MTTEDKALYLALAAALAAAGAWARTVYERQPLSFWRRVLILVMSGVVGGGFCAFGMAFGIPPVVSAIGGAVVGSAGEMLLAGVWKVGHEFQRDPIKTAGEVADVARGQKDGEA